MAFNSRKPKANWWDCYDQDNDDSDQVSYAPMKQYALPPMRSVPIQTIQAPMMTSSFQPTIMQAMPTMQAYPRVQAMPMQFSTIPTQAVPTFQTMPAMQAVPIMQTQPVMAMSTIPTMPMQSIQYQQAYSPRVSMIHKY